MKNDEFKSIIDFAIENEIEAYEFYRDAAEKIENPELKDVFKDLAKEEMEHRKFLQDFLVSEANTINLDAGVDYKVSETIDKPVLSVEMDFSDAIALAIKNEEEAMHMYSSLAEACVDDEEKDLFLGLEEMERMHKTRLEKLFLETGYAEVW